jgi:Tfp pilus assembly protein PilF
MNPWHKKTLLIACAVALMWPVFPVCAAGFSDDCRQVRFYVKDSTGFGIPNAILTLDQTWVLTTDFDGAVEIECRPNFRSAIPVEVSAQGFKRKSEMIRLVGLTGAEIRLEKETRESVPAGPTVSAAELAPEVQERSEKLQKEGLDALARGENEKAEEALREALELTPSSGGIYNNIGVAHLRRQDMDKAAEWFEKAALVSPYNPVILGNLGLIRYLQHREEESYPLLDRGVAGGFSSPTAHYVLGILALQRGHYLRAVEQLRNTDSTRHPYRDLYLSIAQRELGRVKAADKTFQSFVKTHKAPLASVVGSYRAGRK